MISLWCIHSSNEIKIRKRETEKCIRDEIGILLDFGRQIRMSIYLMIGWYMQRTSDTRLNWSISWCNWEIFSALEIDASCKEVRHSRSSRNSLSTPFALASLSAASAPKIFILSTAPDFTSSISLHLIKSNSWRSKHRCAVLHSPSSLVRDAKDNFRETRKFTHEGWCSEMLS